MAARLCRRLYTIERYPDLLRDAEARFAELGLSNITARAGDGTLGWPEQVPFERILVTAAAADVPAPLVDQLATGGVMVVPVDDGTDEGRRLIQVRRTGGGAETEDLGVVKFVPLVPDREQGAG